MADKDNNWAVVGDLMIQELQGVRKAVAAIDTKLDTKIEKMNDKIDSRIKWKVFTWIVTFIILGVAAVATTASYNNVNLGKTSVILETHIKSSDEKLDNLKIQLKDHHNNGGTHAVN